MATSTMRCAIILIAFAYLYLALAVPNMKDEAKNLVFIGAVDNKHYFAESALKMNWTTARKFCNSSGMRLATITSPAQEQFLRDAYNNVTFTGWFWTAGYEVLTQDSFRWEGLNTAPNTSTGLGSSVTRDNCCLTWYIHILNSHLHVQLCSDSYGILCEIA